MECDNSLLAKTILVGGAVGNIMLELRLIHGMLIIHGMLTRPWDICLRHVSRTQNMVADGLTNFASPTLTHLILMDVPPQSVRKFLLVDSNPSNLI